MATETILISANIKGDTYEAQLEATTEELFHAAALMVPGLDQEKFKPDTEINIQLHTLPTRSGTIGIRQVIMWALSRQGQKELVGDPKIHLDELKALGKKLGFLD